MQGWVLNWNLGCCPAQAPSQHQWHTALCFYSSPHPPPSFTETSGNYKEPFRIWEHQRLISCLLYICLFQEMWACSCFLWVLFVNFHLRHTGDSTWAVPSWNDNAGKLKDFSTLKKSSVFHSDKHICRSAALLREMEKWSLLPLILCVTSHLSVTFWIVKDFLHCGIFLSSGQCHWWCTGVSAPERWLYAMSDIH